VKRRWVEYFLLFAGLVALDYVVWTHAGADFAQAFESWSFEQDLRGRPASIRGFLRAEWNLLAGKQTDAEKAGKPWQSNPSPSKRSPSKPQSVIGRVEIPRLKLNVMIREGVDAGTLRAAVGHIPSTSLPGDPGNVALAAHRDTYFLPLEHIANGDLIEVETRVGIYQYVVESMQVVKPRDVWVLNASNHPTLTLVTCFPFRYVGAAPQRFVVRAAQVGTATKSPMPSGS